MPGMDAPLDLAQVAPARSAGTSRQLVYPKTDGRLYSIDSTGLETLAGQELKMLAPVRVSSALNPITLSGTQTIDGVACVAGDRVLVRWNGPATQNGIYVVAAGAWSRAPDADTAAKIARGTKVIALEGNADRYKVFTQTATLTTLGTDNVEWRLHTAVDIAGSLQYPGALGDGHIFWDRNAKALAGWDGSWQRLNGVRICTSTTRPAFTGEDAVIFESDTALAYIYNGGWRPFGAVTVLDEGASPVAASVFDFIGAGVTVTRPTDGRVSVTIPGGGGSGGSFGNLPVGAVVPWAGGAEPTGFLLCDGAVVLRATYAALFTAIGTSYNTGGEAADSFRLPNLKGRVPVGLGDTADNPEFNAMGKTGGEKAHAQTVAEMAQHWHGNQQFYYYIGSGGQNTIGGGTALSAKAMDMMGSGTPANVIQPYITLRYIIRALPASGDTTTVHYFKGVGPRRTPRWSSPPNVNMPFATRTDPANAWNATSNHWVVPAPGRYRVTTRGQGQQQPGTVPTMAIIKNGATVVYSAEPYRRQIYSGMLNPDGRVRLDRGRHHLSATGREQVYCPADGAGIENTFLIIESVGLAGTPPVYSAANAVTLNAQAVGAIGATVTPTTGTAVTTAAGLLVGTADCMAYNVTSNGMIVEFYIDGVLIGQSLMNPSTATAVWQKLTTLAFNKMLTAGTHYFYFRLNTGSAGERGSVSGVILNT